MSAVPEFDPGVERLSAITAAMREAAPRTLTVAEAVGLLRSAREGLEELERTHPTGAVELLSGLVDALPLLPAPPGGWTFDALADLIADAGQLPPDSPATAQRVVPAAQVLDLPAARARREHAEATDDGVRGVPVDGQVVFHPATPTAWGGPHRQVFPDWLRDRSTVRSAAWWAVNHAWHTSAFHAVRLPVYWARLAAQSPNGAWLLARGVTAWTLDAQGAPIRRALSAAADRTTYDLHSAQAYVRLEEQRRSLVRTRVAITAAGAAVALVFGWGLVASLPAWQTAFVAAALAALLGAAGRDVSVPVLSRAVDTEAAPRLTSDLILTALGGLGIAELNKGLKSGTDVRFPSPITRDGAGWRADIDLPAGVTAGDVAERRDRLASGLRRPLSCVWPEANHDVHTGRLVLWVADKPMSSAKPVAWPLADKGRVNLFEPFPIGVDPRGRKVTTELMFVSCIIGAMPRMGKTFSLRVVVLGAALDPRAELHLYDLKGGADWLPLEAVAHAFRIGDEPDDIAYLLADLRAAVADMTARYKTLRSLGRDVCPEGKVTDALASDKSLGLHPVVFVLDECQRAFEDPVYGKEIAALCEDLAKRGPAAGIVTMFATQRPDSASLPKPISSNAAWRLCFKVAGQVENDMVLGTSAYQGGTRATMFARSDKGVGYLAGEADEPVIVRMAYIDATDADTITARARAARIAAGRLTGHAAGTDPDTGEHSETVLDHLAAIWPTGQEQVWCDTLAERLTEAYPSTYYGWTAENVTSAVKPHGLNTRQIKRDGINRRGLKRADLLAAIENHTDGLDDPAATDAAG